MLLRESPRSAELQSITKKVASNPTNQANTTIERKGGKKRTIHLKPNQLDRLVEGKLHQRKVTNKDENN